MKSALLSNACGIIMYHNHPSGNSTPSQEDFQITEKLKEPVRLWTFNFRSYHHWKRKLLFNSWRIYETIRYFKAKS